MIALSRHILVLLEAEVTGLRNAHALRTAVTNIAGKNRVFTLLNRANRADTRQRRSRAQGCQNRTAGVPGNSDQSACARNSCLGSDFDCRRNG